MKLGSTASVELCCWDKYCCFNESKVSLSSCNEADGVMEGREGDGAMDMVVGRAVVLNTEVDS